MQEILPAMKLVKYYGWEDFFERKVLAIRGCELVLSIWNSALKILNVALVFTVPPLTAFLIFTSYEFNVKRVDSTLAFTILTMFNILRFPLVVLPKALRAASGA
jgi:ATP-binding cassette, subfamily C (CFTR/MRP), member 1